MKQNNPIQERINQLVQKWTLAINTPKVKVVRILSDEDEQDMIDTLFEYMLAIDTNQEDFVMILESPFSTLEDFGKELLQEFEQEIENWNTAEIPEDLGFKKITWKPDYTLGSNSNHAELLIKNLNSFANYLKPKKETKVSFVIRMYYCTTKLAKEWFDHLLQIPMESHLIIGISDSQAFRVFDKTASRYPVEVHTIVPNLNMDGAMEQLASSGDPTKVSSRYRINLTKLMNAVKNREENKTQKYGESCLNIATKEIKKDPNWLSQIVTIYTILYNDQIGYRRYDDALFFADKAVETSLLTIGLLEPSMAYRLIGQAHIGRGTLNKMNNNKGKALEDYEKAAKSYAACEDHLMHCEALRLCGWVSEKIFNYSEATKYYIEAYPLIKKLSPDMVQSSTFPYIIKKLMNNSSRKAKISDAQMNKDLTPIFGDDWKDVVASYGKKPENQPETEQTF